MLCVLCILSVCVCVYVLIIKSVLLIFFFYFFCCLLLFINYWFIFILFMHWIHVSRQYPLDKYDYCCRWCDVHHQLVHSICWPSCGMLISYLMTCAVFPCSTWTCTGWLPISTSRVNWLFVEFCCTWLTWFCCCNCWFCASWDWLSIYTREGKI